MSPEQRDGMSEVTLTEYDLRHIENAAGVSETSLRRMVRDRIREERTARADEQRVRGLAQQFDTTEDAIREAEAQVKVERQRATKEWQLSAARRAIGANAPTPPTHRATEAIPRITARWLELVQTGRRPSRRLVADLEVVDRGSLSRWEKAGWLRLPPD